MKHDLDQYRGCNDKLDQLIQYATDMTLESLGRFVKASTGMDVIGLHTDNFMSPKAIDLHVDSGMLVVKFDWRKGNQTGWMSYVVRFNGRGRLSAKLMTD